MITLSRRLQALCDQIDQDVAADIGCDHAYVICRAIQDKKARKGYACEVAAGPLENARDTIVQEHLEDAVFPRLQNGLEGLPEDVQQVIIAGMGGRTIIDILSQAPARNMSYILSPHSEAPLLRKYLQDHGYEIFEERIVADEGRYYPILKVSGGSLSADDSVMDLTSCEELYGRNLILDADALEYLASEKEKWSGLLSKVPKERARELEERIGMIGRLLVQGKDKPDEDAGLV